MFIFVFFRLPVEAPSPPVPRHRAAPDILPAVRRAPAGAITVANSVEITGGERFTEGLTELGRRLSKPSSLSVGFLAGATYPNGTSVPMVAAIMEYGAPRAGIPPRPFFRNAIAAHKGEWSKVLGEQLRLTGGDATLSLSRLGALIAGEVRESITQLTEPPLSQVTLMIRQIIGPNGQSTFADVLEARRRVAAGERASGVSDKPLVWTGHLLNSVEFEIASDGTDQRFADPAGSGAYEVV